MIAAGGVAPKAHISIRNASQSRSRSSIGASPQRKLRPVARVHLTIRSRTAIGPSQRSGALQQSGVAYSPVRTFFAPSPAIHTPSQVRALRSSGSNTTQRRDDHARFCSSRPQLSRMQDSRQGTRVPCSSPIARPAPIRRPGPPTRRSGWAVRVRTSRRRRAGSAGPIHQRRSRPGATRSRRERLDPTRKGAHRDGVADPILAAVAAR
jgi:hypothetical protein